jgi:hypothetical protein
MSDTTDNIADEPIVPSVDDSATDEYMRKFELVEARIQACSRQMDVLRAQPNRDARVVALVNWTEHQQKAIEDIYDLLVEMNNYWAKK